MQYYATAMSSLVWQTSIPGSSWLVQVLVADPTSACTRILPAGRWRRERTEISVPAGVTAYPVEQITSGPRPLARSCSMPTVEVGRLLLRRELHLPHHHGLLHLQHHHHLLLHHVHAAVGSVAHADVRVEVARLVETDSAGILRHGQSIVDSGRGVGGWSNVLRVQDEAVEHGDLQRVSVISSDENRSWI